MSDADIPVTKPARVRAAKPVVKVGRAQTAKGPDMQTTHDDVAPPATVEPTPVQPVIVADPAADAQPVATAYEPVAYEPVPPPSQSEEPKMATAFETTQDTVKSTVHQLNASAEAAMNNGKAAMEQVAAKSKEAVEASIKSLDEMTEMARGNVEALMASARAATAGIEQISAHVSEVSKKAFDDVAAAVKAMTSAKTPNELLQLQSDFTKTQFDNAVAEFSKMTEMMVKLTGEVMEPVQNRMALAADKLKASFTK